MIRPPSKQCLLYIRRSLLNLHQDTCLRYTSECERRSYATFALNSSLSSQHADEAVWSDLVIKVKFPRTTKNNRVAPQLRGAQALRDMPFETIRAVSPNKLQTHLLAYQSAGRWAELIDLYTKYHGTLDSPSQHAPKAHAFQFFVEALCKVKQHSVLTTVLHDFLADTANSRYRVETANILLNYLVKRGHLDQATKTLLALASSNFPLDTISYNTVLHGARLGTDNSKHLRSILNHMRLNGIERDVRTYNILIAYYRQSDDQKRVLQYFEEALARGIADTETFNTIISQEVSRNHLAEAWSLLQIMKKRGIARDEITYSPFILRISKDGRATNMSRLLTAIAEDKISLSTSTFNIMLHHLLMSRMYSQVEQLLHHAFCASIIPSAKTFDTILRFYKDCSASFLQDPLHAALMSLLDMSCRADINILTHNSVAILRRSRSIWEAEQHRDPEARLYIANVDDGSLGEVGEVHQRITKLMQVGKWQQALQYYNEFQKRGLVAPIQILASVMIGLLHLNKLNLAREVYATAKHEKLPRTNLEFQTLMLSFVRPSTVKDDIHRITRVLQDNGVKLDMIFYTAAAWRLYRDEKFPEVIALLRNALALGLALDLLAGIILVECYGKTKDLLGTLWCLQTMKDNKILLDQSARLRMKRVVKTFKSPGDADGIREARRLIAQMPQKRDSRIPRHQGRPPVQSSDSFESDVDVEDVRAAASV